MTEKTITYVDSTCVLLCPVLSNYICQISKKFDVRVFTKVVKQVHALYGILYLGM